MVGYRKIMIAVLTLAVIFAVCAVSDDSDAAAPTTEYGSPDVGAKRLVFDANGGDGGFIQYVLKENVITFPSEYEGKDHYNQYTKISKDRYVLMGWSESSTATTPTYYPGQSFTVKGDRTFYAVWESVEYHRIYGDTEAEHIIVAKGTNVDLPGAYSILAPQMAPVYTLTVEYNGNERYSETKSPNTTMSADWVTCTIDKSGVATISGTPDKSGIYVVTFGFAPTSSSNAVPTKWYVSVADPEKDPSVMYHVTYKGDDIVKGYGPYMTAVKLPDAQDGYHQKGWNITVNQSPAIFPVGGSYSVVQTETEITVNEYTFEEVVASGVVGVIAYNANGGYYSGAFAELVPTDGYAGLKAGGIVSKDGYKFAGWNRTGSSSDPIYPEGYLYDIDSTYVELKAVWVSSSKSTVTVYLKNPGNGSQDTSFEAVSGLSYCLPVHGFELDRFKFLGWADTYFEPGEGEPTEGDFVTPMANCTYYAVFEPATYEFTVKYKAGPGSGQMAPQVEESDKVPFDIILKDSEFTPPDGCSFVGWSKSKYEFAPSYRAGDYLTVYDSGEILLFAVYEEDVSPDDPDIPADPDNPDTPAPVEGNHLFKLMFYGNGASYGTPGNIYRIIAADECTLYIPSSEPVRQGFNFLGWSETQTGQARYEPNKPVVLKLEEGETEKVLALYAVWEKVIDTGDGTKITITFVGETGTIRTITISAGSKVQYTTPQSKECYAFVGWFNGNKAWDFNDAATQAMTLTATYKKVFHTEVKDQKVRVIMDIEDASPIKVSFTDGFQETYTTTSIPAHKIEQDGTVTVEATVDGSVLKAMCKYAVDEPVPVPEPEDDYTMVLVVSGIAVGLAAIGCGLYWRYRI